MKLQITRTELLSTLLNTVGVVEKKKNSNSPVLENVMLSASNEQLTVAGTDLELEAKDTVNCHVESEGSITTPATKLLQAVKTLHKDAFVTLEYNDNGLLFKSGKKEMNLNVISAEDYPLLDGIHDATEYSIEESQLSELLDSVSHSMANQDVRYYLNGMLLSLNDNKLNAVSTDGHRLTISYLDLDSETNDESIIVPRKAILELNKLLNQKNDEHVKIKMSRNHLEVKRGDFVLTTKLIDGKYPDYKAAIPRNIVSDVLVNREEFKDALDFASVTSNEKYKGVRLIFDNNALTVSSNNREGEMSSSVVECDYSGEKLEIGFNIVYLLAAINQSHDEFINIGLQSSSGSALISYDCSNAQHVVMPVRL